VTSEDDQRSTNWTKDIVAASKHPATKLVLYQNAGHGTQMLEKERESGPMIIAWFVDQLAKVLP
jgi:hypothetical protein